VVGRQAQTETTEEGQVMASAASNDDLEALAPAWREFQTRTPVKLRTVENERHYRAMVGLMNKLVDEIGDRETHPLMGLLDIVTFFVRDYEERNIEIPGAEPRAVLRFLMEQHGLRQSDLAEIFGSQSNVSEVLNGKREINARRALATRFGVSAAVFI
jgi:HTH-type transcriptional regulator / antitoxin HigA